MEQEIIRVRRPKEGEIYGVAVTMLGASRITVDCEDGKTRMGRIRGKIRKRVWIRIGDLVLVKPWDIQPNEKCDIIWRYTRTEVNWMKGKGFLKGKDLDI